MSTKIRGEGANIVLTGGHAATTAIAVIDEIKSQGFSWNIYWIGSKYALEGKKITTLEYKALPDHGVIFLPLVMGRLQRRFTFWTIPSLFKIPVGFIQAFYYLLKVRPKAVLSFGGFSSFPVVFCSKLLNIPVIIHEQTAAAGRANLASTPYADSIALSRQESKKYFPEGKSVITGNPVSDSFFRAGRKRKLPAAPAIFITGGSRGSQNMNNIVSEALPKLLGKYKVIHQTGQLDYRKFENLKKSLPPALAKNYECLESIDPPKIINYYEKSDLIISRAGANTVSEILAVGRPAIVIPLPISFLDEQTKNGQILTKNGLGITLQQEKLTGERLFENVLKVFSNYKKYLDNINKFKSPDIEASKKLVNLLTDYIK